MDKRIDRERETDRLKYRLNKDKGTKKERKK